MFCAHFKTSSLIPCDPEQDFTVVVIWSIKIVFEMRKSFHAVYDFKFYNSYNPFLIYIQK